MQHENHHMLPSSKITFDSELIIFALNIKSCQTKAESPRKKNEMRFQKAINAWFDLHKHIFLLHLW